MTTSPSHPRSTVGFDTAMTVAALALAIGPLFCAGLREAVARETDRIPPTATEPDAASASVPGAATPAETPVAPVETPIELRPYRILVTVAVADDPLFDSRIRSELQSSAGVALRGRLGQMWELAIESDRSWLPPSPRSLERWTAEQAAERVPSTDYDKVLRIGVSREGSGFTAFAREWDRSSRTMGAVREQTTFDLRLLAGVLADTVWEAFRPLARIDHVDGQAVELALQAGEFPAVDAETSQLRPGDHLTPYFRHLDRQREVRLIQPVPWTFLRVDSVERARVLCTLVSTFRAPLAGIRRRVEVMAIAARPAFDTTELRVAPRDDPENPLIGYRVEVLSRLPTGTDPVEDRLQLVTDRLGRVSVSADPARPLRHAVVQSGNSILARVPFMPGLERELRLGTPDDAPRLSTEGALAVLEGELIDTVARRAVLIARTRNAAKADRWPDVDQYLKQIDGLPDLDDVTARIRAIELPAVQASRTLGDRVAEHRIKHMCSVLREVAGKHLDEEKLKDFRSEMAELRSAKMSAPRGAAPRPTRP